MQNNNKKSTQFNALEWFNRRVDERTRKVLKEKHMKFAEENECTTDAELLIYLKECAKQLNKTPTMPEVIGGRFIAERFGSWNNAVAMAGLRRSQTPPEITRRKIYKDEFKIQAKLFKEERDLAKKAQKENALRKKQAYKQKLEERNKEK